MEAALRGLAEATPGSAELLRLMDATRSRVASLRSPRNAPTCTAGPATGTVPAIPAGTGGAKLPLICTCDGTVTWFSLANPKLYGERQQARQTLKRQLTNRPASGAAVVTDKGLSGEALSG
jgi:hypothetical protein